MKSNNSIRRITVFLLSAAITLSYMPASFCVYAQDGEDADSGTPKTEAVSEAPKTEEKKAEPEKKEAPQAEEKKAEPEKKEAPQAEEKNVENEKKEETKEEKAEEKNEAAEMQQTEKEESAAAIEAEAAKSEAAEERSAEETAAQETVAEEAPAPVKATPAKNISVKYHFYQLDASGNYTEAKTISRSVSAGKSTTAISKTTANSYVTNKKIEGDNGMVTEFTQVWNNASGKEVSFPLSMSYETAADLTQDGSNVDVKLYAQYSTHKESVKVTLRFDGIRTTNGELTSAETSNSISWGNGWSMTKKKLESTTGLRAGQSFSSNGYRYTYNGLWKDQNGNIIDSASSISITVKNGETSGNKYFTTDDITLTFTPVYDKQMIQGLDVFFIDSISTGSGSWSNKDAADRSDFSSYTHTFKDPSIKMPVEHFSFLYWEKEEANGSTGERFKDGDSYSFTVDSSLPEGTVTTVKFYAYWQPSVTVRYHYNGQTAEAESFESINVYDKSSEIDGIVYNAWYDAEGKKIDEDAAFEAPAPVTEKTDRIIYDLYARRPVTVTAATAEWTYDGKAHSDDMVEVTEGGLFEGDEIVAEVSGSITEVGKIENRIESIKIMRGNEDVSAYYDITTVDGALIIDAAPIIDADPSIDADPAAEKDKSTPVGGKNKTPKTRKSAASYEMNIADSDAPMAASAVATKTEVIADAETPLAGGVWALVNLISAILTALGAAVALFRIKEEEDEDDTYRAEEDDNRSKKMFAAKAAGALAGIAAPITFFLTEDTSLPMVMIDEWTVLMIIILAVQIVAAAFNKKASELDDEDEEGAEAAVN